MTDPELSGVLSQVIVSALVGFLAGGLGVWVTVQVMKHQITWLKEEINKLAKQQSDEWLYVHSRIDGLDGRIAEHLSHHAHARFRE